MRPMERGTDTHRPSPPRRAEDHLRVIAQAMSSESILAEGLTIEGKIEGQGNIRMAGCFKGHIHVYGEVTIEPGASL